MDADNLALLYEVYKGDFAIWAWNHLDHQTIENMIDQTFELRRDPNERERENVQNAIKDWAKNNQTLVEHYMDMTIEFE